MRQEAATHFPFRCETFGLTSALRCMSAAGHDGQFDLWLRAAFYSNGREWPMDLRSL
jgi:hypothetical protein